MRKAEATLALARQLTIDEGVCKFFFLGKDNLGRVTSVGYDHAVWSEALRAKGFFALVSFSDVGARNACEAYQLRDPSVKEFMILKAKRASERRAPTRQRPSGASTRPSSSQACCATMPGHPARRSVWTAAA